MTRLNPYDSGLDPNEVNFVALSPLSFVERTAKVYPHRTAVIYGTRRQTWEQTFRRCRRLASALSNRHVGPAAVCAKQEEWLKRQTGCALPAAASSRVLDPETLLPVPPHGETIGEVFFRGNVVMNGYLKNPLSRELRGQLVSHRQTRRHAPRRLPQDQDRNKDMIISGGKHQLARSRGRAAPPPRGNARCGGRFA